MTYTAPFLKPLTTDSTVAYCPDSNNLLIAATDIFFYQTDPVTKSQIRRFLFTFVAFLPSTLKS